MQKNYKGKLRKGHWLVINPRFHPQAVLAAMVPVLKTGYHDNIADRINEDKSRDRQLSEAVQNGKLDSTLKRKRNAKQPVRIIYEWQ
jgi:hypothetical protein